MISDYCIEPSQGGTATRDPFYLNRSSEHSILGQILVVLVTSIIVQLCISLWPIDQIIYDMYCIVYKLLYFYKVNGSE